MKYTKQRFISLTVALFPFSSAHSKPLNQLNHTKQSKWPFRTAMAWNIKYRYMWLTFMIKSNSTYMYIYVWLWFIGLVDIHLLEWYTLVGVIFTCWSDTHLLEWYTLVGVTDIHKDFKPEACPPCLSLHQRSTYHERKYQNCSRQVMHTVSCANLFVVLSHGSLHELWLWLKLSYMSHMRVKWL